MISTFSELNSCGREHHEVLINYNHGVQLTNPPPTSACCSPVQPYSHQGVYSDSINHHNGEDLLNVARELNKLKAEIQKFKGNPMDYQRFIRQFNTKVCANTSSYEECLKFLLQFTSGDPNRIVTGYSYLNAEGEYNAALDEFKDRYGDLDVVAYVKKALNRQIIKHDNIRTLDDYAIFLTECQYAINNVDSA